MPTKARWAKMTPEQKAKEMSYTKKHQQANPEYWRQMNRKSYQNWTEEAYQNHYARTLLRHKRIKEFMPAWADKEKISAFYKNRPEGYHVDHIIPLHGKNVSGLHVLENLQYLPAQENLSKGNR